MNLNLGVVGNSAISALIDDHAHIVWSCLPRFDGDPVFCRLLTTSDTHASEAGGFGISVDNLIRSEQHYVRNTAILVTTLTDAGGASVEITDFAPRFKQFGRSFRPMMLVRQLRPLNGTPRIRVHLRPAHSYGAGTPALTRGSNHIRYGMPDLVLRCTTSAPVTYVVDEMPFVLEDKLAFILGPDESLALSPGETADRFFANTKDYWEEWCRYLSIPFEWQGAVIRAAITLKLSNFEESGGIVAAMTTSIPESPNSARNWDYRYCWLRDAYFVVKALNRLGAVRTMEDHIHYITNIAAGSNSHLQPVYGITLEPDLMETEVASLAGYRGMRPVRRGNQAYEHIQNDVYGSAIMAATQAFFDARLSKQGGLSLLSRLEGLGHSACNLYDKPDAGPWEFRTKAQTHTYSSVMCWAACDRLAKICQRLDEEARGRIWREKADEIRKTILSRAYNSALETFIETFDGDTVDASLLLLPELNFIDARDPKFLGTLKTIEDKLRVGQYLYRYVNPDDFGTPETSFAICTFWYVDALAAVGRLEEARALFENLLTCRNHLGLLSEDIDPETRELWGNFPQTYSMVGLINSAMRLSKSWSSEL